MKQHEINTGKVKMLLVEVPEEVQQVKFDPVRNILSAVQIARFWFMKLNHIGGLDLLGLFHKDKKEIDFDCGFEWASPAWSKTQQDWLNYSFKKLLSDETDKEFPLNEKDFKEVKPNEESLNKVCPKTFAVLLIKE